MLAACGTAVDGQIYPQTLRGGGVDGRGGRWQRGAVVVVAGLAILLGAAVVLLQLRHDDGPGWSRLVGLESDSCRRLEGRTPGRNTVVSG